MLNFSFSIVSILALSASTAFADEGFSRSAVTNTITTPDLVEEIDRGTPALDVLETLHPVSRIVRSEFSGCRSEIENTSVSFRNIGSMCADGLYALMEGRGCTEVVGARSTTGNWTYHRCKTQPTCDNLHNNTFAIVPVGTSITENFGEDKQVWCTDNNYIIIKM